MTAVKVRVKAPIIMSPTDIAFQQALDDLGQAIFQRMLVEYVQRGEPFRTLWDGPNLVLELEGKRVTPTQFRLAVDQSLTMVESAIDQLYKLIVGEDFDDVREV